MACLPLSRNVPCNIANALYVCDRRAAEFHHKTGHPVENASPPAQIFVYEVNGANVAPPRIHANAST
jgi:hypothetical protein